jgi:hypothetical protein
MKKLMIIAAIAATMVSPAETGSVDPAREKAMKMLSDYEAGYETNGFWKADRLIGPVYSFLNWYATDPEFKAEATRIMSQKPARYFLTDSRLPRPLIDKALEYVEREFPMYVRLIKRYSRGEGGPLTDEEILQGRLEGFAVARATSCIDNFRASVIRMASFHLRRKLRAEGKPIVGDAGKAIIQERIDAVAKALDEPFFTGMQEALAGCGISIKTPVSYEHAYTMDEVNERIERVYYGDILFSKHQQTLFRFYLGTKKYNEFVDRYNSGVQK